MVDAQEMKLSELFSTDKLVALVRAKITGVRQTAGPTIFFLQDETASIKAAAFAGKGKRAYPHIEKDDFVKAQIVIQINKENERSFVIQAMEKLSEKEIKELAELMEKAKEEQIKIEEFDFFVRSEVYEKLRPYFEKTALEILRSINAGKPVFIRHHNDIDGYLSAMLLERAINIVCEATKTNNLWVSRIALRTPFYGYSDLLRDISLVEQYNDVKPILILLDNGSSKDDMLSLKKAKKAGFEIVVVDHHPPWVENNKVVVNEIAGAHLNPYLARGDKNICSAMLSFELARIISKSPDMIDGLVHWVGIAILADKCKGDEAKEYLNRCEKEYEQKLLEKARWCVDFTIYSMKNVNSTRTIENILDLNKTGKELIEIIYPYVEDLMSKQLEIMKKYCEKINTNNVVMYFVDMNCASFHYDYPPAGRAIGLFFEEMKKENKNVVVIGIAGDGLIVRVAEELEEIYGKEKMEEILKKKVSKSIDLGGHDVAYTIKAPACCFEEIKEILIHSRTKMVR